MITSYSRRQLYAFGEPLGDCVTRKEGGRIVYGGGDSGGSSQPSSTTQTLELPEWARGYAQDTLAKTAALTNTSQNPYAPYRGNRIAGFSPLQQQAQQQATDMRTSGLTGLGGQYANLATLGALGTQYNPTQFQNPFSAPNQYQTGLFDPQNVSSPQLNQYGMGPAERVTTESFNRPGTAQDFMSPYMQNVVDIQQREAQRQADIQGTQRGASAAKSGAFGGSRQAIMDAEAARNLATQKGDIQATGQQAAFQNAQQQFNAEQNSRMQAALANQGAGLTVGQQNLGAQLGIQQLGAGQNMQAQLANQQYGMDAQRMREQSRQFGAGQDMTAAQQRAQFGQAAQQLGEQSKQYGAGLGLQGLQAALQGAGQMGTLGGQQFAQGMDINKLQNAYGGQQQALQQQGLSQTYQDFQNQQNYPYKQLGFMSDMIRGLPLGQQSTKQVYEAEPGMGSQLVGLGTAAYGLSKFMAEGGITGDANVSNILESLTNEQLEQSKQIALQNRDQNRVEMIEAEQQRRAQAQDGISAAAPAQGGIASAASDEMMDRMLPTEEGMARGGIVAFATGGAPDITTMSPDDNYKSVKEYAQRLLQRRNATEAFSGADPETSSSSKTPAGRGYAKGVAGLSGLLKRAGPLGLAYELFGTSDADKQELAKNDPEYAAELKAEAEKERAKLAKAEASTAPKGGGLADTPEAKQPAVMPPDIGARRERPAAATAGGAPTGGRDLMQIQDDVYSKMKTSDKGDPYAAQNKAIGDMFIKQKEDEKTALLADQAKFATAYDERGKRLDTRKADLDKRKDEYAGIALVKAGATAAFTPGSFATAIGKGALVGSEAFASGYEKIQTARDLLDKATDDLEDLRLNRSEMSAKEIRLANSNISGAKIKAIELARDGAKEAGAKSDAKAKTVVEAMFAQDRDIRNNAAAAARVASAADRPDATERSMKELGDIGSGKASYMGKTGAAGVKAYRENRAAALGVRYTGQDKTTANTLALERLMQGDETVKSLNMKNVGLMDKTDKASQTKLAANKAEIQRIRNRYIAAMPGGAGAEVVSSAATGVDTANPLLN